MGFDPDEVEKLLVRTGRQCCLCRRLHNVQVHHIEPVEEGGSNDIDNAIPLCPNCHDEVHVRRRYTPGQTTRVYTPAELRQHRQLTIESVQKQEKWAPGTPTWEEDRNLILFFAQCLDRPAFRTPFHMEISFSAFDRAMEDTLVALNTGYWRMRDRTLIDRAQGKVHIVHPPWREKMERIAEIVEEIRHRFRDALELDGMLYQPSWSVDSFLRYNRGLGDWMDEQRQEAIEIMNSLLEELGHQPLRGIRER